MKHSEFWSAVEAVFGSAYGRSLAQDLVVPALGMTCVEALAVDTPPRKVWDALCDETRRSEEERWVLLRGSRGRRYQ